MLAKRIVCFFNGIVASFNVCNSKVLSLSEAVQFRDVSIKEIVRC